ncbi:MAG TPA: hypothetical protein VFV10_14650 [Gammaproteobacteria bacterium]|nr:hypothetical protein [Gammaproteobacteria bacterium]
MTAIRPTLKAALDRRLAASIDSIVPVFYADGAAPTEDLPRHVRAASAIRRFGDGLLIVQDDVNALAVVDARGAARPILLPRGPGGRRRFDDTIGNKHDKLDLEACAALPDGRLVAFGSGATRRRESLVVASEGAPPRVVHAPVLYAALRAQPAFAGRDLNVEGALVSGGELLLFQRATGPARAGGTADRGASVSAIGSLPLDAFLAWLDEAGPAPDLSSVTAVDLGEVEGKAFGFTDAALLADGRIAVLACAEDAPDAVSDGPVLGCRFGLIDGVEIRLTEIIGPDGRPSTLKLEGIEPREGKAGEFDVVADPDRTDQPAVLARLRVREG